MESHVFAVWDFMSLAKRLQSHFAPVSIPWMPPRDPIAARLVNEIILGEESDHSVSGGYSSHFVLYLGAMREIGANTSWMEQCLGALQDAPATLTFFQVEDVFKKLPLPRGVLSFVTHTLDVALNGTIEEVMGAFFYGREQLVPQLFEDLLSRWGLAKSSVPTFAYYLDRHIQIDRDEHGPMMAQLLERCIGGDERRRERAVSAAQKAIAARIALWDHVLAGLVSKNG